MPSYKSFDTAWSDFKGKYNYWRDHLITMESKRVAMQTAFLDNNWRTAFFRVNDWMSLLGWIHENALDMGQSYWQYNQFWSSIYYAWKENPGIEEPEITMDSILSVMVTATDTQLKNFIGLVDAYRQSLWNKDFDAEYFAALARGFES